MIETMGLKSLFKKFWDKSSKEFDVDTVLFSSKSTEHTTPEHIWKAAEEVFGGVIYLDPCSDENETVRAMVHYKKRDDGLKRPWQGSVYINPPYSKKKDEGCEPWIDMAKETIRQQFVKEVIMLLPARTDTKWFRKLIDYPICFIEGRLKFGGSGKGNSAPFPSCLVYMGNNVVRFAQVFQQYGHIYNRFEVNIPSMNFEGYMLERISAQPNKKESINDLLY